MTNHPDDSSKSDPEVIFIIPEKRVDEYLGVEYLVASLEHHGVCCWITQWHDEAKTDVFKNHLLYNQRLLLIGIPWLYIFSEVSVTFIAKWIKELRPDVPIVVGGHPPTFEYSRILDTHPEIDFVIRGEGDESSIDLLISLRKRELPNGVAGLAYRDQSGQVVVTPPRQQISPIDKLPFPARKTLRYVLNHYRSPDRVLVRMIGSRGCYARCEFCSMVSFYSLDGQGMTWRPRTPQNICDEIAQVVHLFGVRRFWFADDEFIGPPKIGVPRLLQFAELLQAQRLDIEFGFDARANGITAFTPDQLIRLRQAGLRMVAMGLESGSQAALNRMNKGMHVETNWQAIRLLIDAGIDYRYGFIMYDEQTTISDLKQNLQFLWFAEPHKICNTGPFRLLNAEFPEVGTPLSRRMGLETHTVDIHGIADFPRLDERQLGYRFADERVSRYRALLSRLASELIDPITIPRPTDEPQLNSDVWYGVNNLPRNVSLMKIFLRCHEWLLDRTELADTDMEIVYADLAQQFYRGLREEDGATL